jgi:hypothetical protein
MSKFEHRLIEDTVPVAVPEGWAFDYQATRFPFDKKIVEYFSAPGGRGRGEYPLGGPAGKRYTRSYETEEYRLWEQPDGSFEKEVFEKYDPLPPPGACPGYQHAAVNSTAAVRFRGTAPGS